MGQFDNVSSEGAEAPLHSLFHGELGHLLVLRLAGWVGEDKQCVDECVSSTGLFEALHFRLLAPSSSSHICVIVWYDELDHDEGGENSSFTRALSEVTYLNHIVLAIDVTTVTRCILDS